MKFILTVVAGIIVGACGVYFTLDWQEEKLEFSITSPAKFGDINYQNITLSNTGWNPAVNIKIYIQHSQISLEDIQAPIYLKPFPNEKNGLAIIDRIRRNETLVLSLAYTGEPLLGSNIRIVSDRSIAKQLETETNAKTSFWQIGMWIIGIIFIFSCVSIPAYRDYKIRSLRAQAAMKARKRSSKSNEKA